MSANNYAELSKEQLLLELQRMKEQIDTERRRSEGLVEELKHAKEQNIIVQKQVEQEEEYITNKLMKRLEQLKREKVALATEVEQEEEFLTNTLQKRLEKLAKEKIDLENKLEAEQEYIVNKLQRKLDQLIFEKNKLHTEKIDLENQLEAEQEYIMNKLQKQVDRLGSEKKSLLKEKSDLKGQVGDLAAAVEKLCRDKVNLENQMEMEEESIVNRLQRHLEALVRSHKSLEAKLEARGISLREMGLDLLEFNSSDMGRVYSRSHSISSNSGSLHHSSASSPPWLGRTSSGVPAVGSRRISGENPHLPSFASQPLSSDDERPGDRRRSLSTVSVPLHMPAPTK